MKFDCDSAEVEREGRRGGGWFASFVSQRATTSPPPSTAKGRYYTTEHRNVSSLCWQDKKAVTARRASEGEEEREGALCALYNIFRGVSGSPPEKNR